MTRRSARMRACWLIPMWLAVVAVTPVASADPQNARAMDQGWPDTPAGRVAAGWVEAFAGGEEAMRDFLTAHVAKDSLKTRPLETRMRSYRNLHDRTGDLVLAGIEASARHELTVVLLAEDASRHRFRFNVGGKPPHALLQVAILQHAATHHGGHGHGGR